MRLLRSTIHPDLSDSILNESTLTASDPSGLLSNSFTRKAARGIILDGDNILMLYTERYHDYSIPGGGIDAGESNEAGLLRELEEETGAKHIEIISEFGLYEEYRPWYKDDFDRVHMLSYCYVCNIHPELGETKFEQHEIQNGMTPVWINIFDAIKHNEHTIASSPKKGMSIERETFLLKLIVKELL